MRIVVRGIPAAQGSKRHVGRGIMVESSRAVGPWREAVRAETQRAMNGFEPEGGPVRIDVTFWLIRPASHYRTGRNAHLLKDTAPTYPAGKRDDVDKLSRAVLDGLTAGGAYDDDGRVVLLVARKVYAIAGSPAGCMIDVEPMWEL